MGGTTVSQVLLANEKRDGLGPVRVKFFKLAV